MYCPHCGTELPENLNWDELEGERWTKEFSCPNEECGTILVIIDMRAIDQEGKTAIEMH